MLELINVKKQFGDQVVLDIPQFKFGEGVYWLKGINGSGKTTLLKLMAGLIPFEGEMVLQENFSLRKNRLEYLRRVNYAEAEPLYPPLISGHDLLALFLKSKRGNLNETESLMKLLKVDEYAARPIGTYSSGMVKKLSLVLALTGTPAVILLDEPLVTIDDQSVEAVYRIIEDFHSSKGITFIITSHQHFDEMKIRFQRTLVVNNKSLEVQ